jgi:hypothetical protein
MQQDLSLLPCKGAPCNLSNSLNTFLKTKEHLKMTLLYQGTSSFMIRDSNFTLSFLSTEFMIY